MRFVLLLTAVIASTLIGSCNQHQKTEGRIFERKHLSQNKLQIKYQYNAEGKLYIDSAAIENLALLSDTIIVVFKSENPAESFPELDK